MMTYLGATTFMSPALQRQANALRDQIQRNSQELTTGQRVDQGKAIGGDFTALNGIDNSLAKLQGFKAVTGEMTLLASAMQTAIAQIDTAAQSRSRTLLLLPETASSSEMNSAIIGSTADFGASISALNLRLSGRAIFSGQESSTAPLPNADTILQSLESAVASETTASGIHDAVVTFFSTGGGYDAIYVGGPSRSPVPVSANESVSLTTTALDPAFRETLIGLATAALVERGTLSTSTEARSSLLRYASSDLLASAEARTHLAAEIGVVEERVETAIAQNESERSAYDILRLGMTEADPYESAAQLKEAEARLDAFYTLVSRLSTLRLSDYL